MRVLRLGVSVYNVYIKKLVLNHFCSRSGEKNPKVEMTVNSKEENYKDFCPDYFQEFGLN